MKKKDKDLVKEFYNLALYDYEKGTDLEELKIILNDYEDKEMYLQCAGINLAIQYIEFLIYLEIIIYINEINDNATNQTLNRNRT
tara:strand:+ start:4986 stop:5240 length:255 start_codon:yes stop_codon:yes gene_type:complete